MCSMEHPSEEEKDVPFEANGSLQRGFAETVNETAHSRFALQQRLLQANAAADVLGDLQQQRQQIAAHQQLQQLQQHHRLGALHHQQQLIQQHLQQQQQQHSPPTRLSPHPLASLLAGHPSRLGLPANQLGISGLSPFGHSLAEARLLAPTLNPTTASHLTRLPPSAVSNLDAVHRTELLRSALLGTTTSGAGSSLSASLGRGDAGMQASTILSQQQHHHQPAGATAEPKVPSTVGSVLDQYLAKGAKEPPFPLKLHQILSNPEYQDCICWLPHGKAWRILKPSAFEQIVIPHFFRHAKYASFMRQVNGWGFKRMVQGVEHNSYYHELFIRERPELCLKMKRTGNTTSKSQTGGNSATMVTTAEKEEQSSITKSSQTSKGLEKAGSNLKKQTEMASAHRGNELPANLSM